MKNIKLILIILLCLYCLKLLSQGEFVVEIDRTNGSFIKTGRVISGITYVYPNIRAYNENNGVFIFPGADTPTRLYSIDVTDDSIVNNPVYNNLLGEFEYCNSLNFLCGIFQNNPANEKYFVSIDPASGVYSPIGDTIQGSGSFQGRSSFDQNNKRYFIIDGSGKIYAINAANGIIISNPSLVLTANEDIVSIAFNDSTNKLYGILYDSSVYLNFLISINTTTGNITKIGTGYQVGINGSSAIDQINQQYLYLSLNNTSYLITTIDLNSGGVIYSNNIPAKDCDNFYSLKYDNLREKLYAIHWDCLIESISEQNIQLTNNIILYQNEPNPFDESTVIRYFIPETVTASAYIVFCDFYGKEIKKVEIKDKGFGNINADTQNLTGGIYTYSLMIDGVVMDTKKMVKE
jgi:hypothetical protein